MDIEVRFLSLGHKCGYGIRPESTEGVFLNQNERFDEVLDQASGLLYTAEQHVISGDQLRCFREMLNRLRQDYVVLSRTKGCGLKEFMTPGGDWSRSLFKALVVPSKDVQFEGDSVFELQLL